MDSYVAEAVVKTEGSSVGPVVEDTIEDEEDKPD